MKEDIEKLFNELDKIIELESYYERTNLYIKIKKSFIEYINKLKNQKWQK